MEVPLYRSAPVYGGSLHEGAPTERHPQRGGSLYKGTRVPEYAYIGGPLNSNTEYSYIRRALYRRTHSYEYTDIGHPSFGRIR